MLQGAEPVLTVSANKQPRVQIQECILSNPLYKSQGVSPSFSEYFDFRRTPVQSLPIGKIQEH